MDFTTVCWILSIALVVAICFMAAGLVTFVLTAIEQVQRIVGNHARD